MNQVSNILRKAKVLFAADYFRYLLMKVKRRNKNKQFALQHPTVTLPPDYLMYESFDLDYKKYYSDSQATIKWLMDFVKKHKPLTNIKILEWGCGPGRLIRHLPALTDKNCAVYGSDYNIDSINWCRKNIHGVTFIKNDLQPPINFENDFFDVVYAYSVFTHLSEELHMKWYDEIYRILKKGGILLITSQGRSFREKLSTDELKKIDNGKLVVRGNVKEGHRTYSAFHPQQYMQKLFRDAEVLEFVERESINNKPQQDIWVIRK